MIPVKVECGCGQRYAFEVEPVAGRMAAPVNCPVCGADGTAAANEVIARTLPAVSGAAPAPKLHLNHSAPVEAASPPPVATPPVRSLRERGLVDPDQAEFEARAKISWGESPESVLQYLMIQRFSHEEASALVAEMCRERLAAVRSNGIKKILSGAGMILASASGIGYLLHIKIMPLSLGGITVAIGLWGAWLAISGAILVLAPKMQSGDVAED